MLRIGLLVAGAFRRVQPGGLDALFLITLNKAGDGGVILKTLADGKPGDLVIPDVRQLLGAQKAQVQRNIAHAGHLLVGLRRLRQFKDGLAVGNGGLHQFGQASVVGRGVNAERNGLFLRLQGFAVLRGAACEIPDGDGGDLVVRHVRHAGFLRIIHAHGGQLLERAQQHVHHGRVRIQGKGVRDFPGAAGSLALQGDALASVVDFNGGGHGRMQEQGAVVPELADTGLEQGQDIAGAHQDAGVPPVEIRLHVGGIVRGLVLRIVHQPGSEGPQRVAGHGGGALAVVAHLLQGDGDGRRLHAELLQGGGINLVQGQRVHDAGGICVLEDGRRRARVHAVVPRLLAPPDAVGLAAELRNVPHAIDAHPGNLVHLLPGIGEKPFSGTEGGAPDDAGQVAVNGQEHRRADGGEGDEDKKDEAECAHVLPAWWS